MWNCLLVYNDEAKVFDPPVKSEETALQVLCSMLQLYTKIQYAILAISIRLEVADDRPIRHISRTL